MTTMEIVNVCAMSDSAINRNVKIAGTDWDRHKKITSDMKAEMVRLHEEEGYSFSQIAEKFNVGWSTVKCNVDSDYYAEYKLRKSGKHYGKRDTAVDRKNRAEYKKRLVMNDVKNIEVVLSK